MTGSPIGSAGERCCSPPSSYRTSAKAAAASGIRPPNVISPVAGEGHAHYLTVPAGKLECIRAPAAIRTDRYNLAIFPAQPPSHGVALEQEIVLARQAVDALGVDRGQTVGSPLAL